MKKLKGKQALVLAECCKHNKEKKEADKKLKKARAKLNLDESGEYTNSAGDILVVVEVKNKTDVDPQELFKAMKKAKKQNKFFSVVKVNLKLLGEVFVQKDIDKLRKKAPSTLKFTFK